MVSRDIGITGVVMLNLIFLLCENNSTESSKRTYLFIKKVEILHNSRMKGSSVENELRN